jgi:hypothetical protein
MNSRLPAVLLAALSCGGAGLFGANAKSTSDLLPAARRQPSVELAGKLARPPAPAPLPEELKNPFNPPDFDRPAASEGRGGKPDEGNTANGPLPPGDRELLESIAARIPSSGAITFGNKTLLTIGTNRLQIGDVFTVTDPVTKQDYDLELVRIDRTTFTLRYRGEEITRPIRSISK